MLMRFDPFRELDRLTQQAFSVASRPAMMPMDAYRQDEHYVVHFDLPGVDPASIEVTVEDNVLTVTAERSWPRGENQELIVSERPQGRFTRQLFLGEGLDADHIEASYEAGVLTLRLPVAEHAKPRKVPVALGGGRPKAIETASSEVSSAAA
jgi:HSP20 family protein